MFYLYYIRPFSTHHHPCPSSRPSHCTPLPACADAVSLLADAAPSLPVWVDYGSRSGRSVNLGLLARTGAQSAARTTFTYWASDVALARSVDSDCAAVSDGDAGLTHDRGMWGLLWSSQPSCF